MDQDKRRLKPDIEQGYAASFGKFVLAARTARETDVVAAMDCALRMFRVSSFDWPSSWHSEPTLIQGGMAGPIDDALLRGDVGFWNALDDLTAAVNSCVIGLGRHHIGVSRIFYWQANYTFIT